MTKAQELALVMHSIALNIPHADDTGHEIYLQREWQRVYEQWQQAIQIERMEAQLRGTDEEQHGRSHL